MLKVSSPRKPKYSIQFKEIRKVEEKYKNMVYFDGFSKTLFSFYEVSKLITVIFLLTWIFAIDKERKTVNLAIKSKWYIY